MRFPVAVTVGSASFQSPSRTVPALCELPHIRNPALLYIGIAKHHAIPDDLRNAPTHPAWRRG
jgi:hypothetical protein